MGIDALLLAAREERMDIPTGWAQGRACYGGLVGGLMVSHLLAKVPNDRSLRSLTVSFVGPVAPGAIELSAEIFRSGKSVTQAECRLKQNGEVLGVLLASFGASRVSQLKVEEKPAPEFLPPEELPAFPNIPGVTPDFASHFEMRWAHGGMPFTGNDSPDIGGWFRFREPTQTMDAALMTALIDAWPPAVLGMLKTIAPGSSLTWTLELVGDASALTGDSWWQYMAETDFAAEGYAHIQARVWTSDGKLVAISRQTATVFA